MRFFAVTCLSVAALAGCASIIDKPYQMIYVDTPGVAGAECTLETPNVKYHVLTPAGVEVERSADSLSVACEAAGYLVGRKEVASHVKGRTALNALNGFLGVAYDSANNAVYAYPRHIEVEMEKDPGAVLE